MVIAAGFVAATISIVIRGIRLFPLTFAVVAGLAFVLGLPLYLAARSAGNATLTIAAIAGFLVGAVIPVLLVLAGPAAETASVGAISTVLEGSYTAFGWLQNFAMMLGFGIAGAIGGIAFFAIVSGLGDPAEVGNFRITMLVGTAACLLVAAFTTTRLTMDRSCHNPLRNGDTTNNSIAGFTLLAGKDQWPKAEAILSDFQRSNDWAIRSNVRLGDDFPWFQVSICKEPGTQIFAQGTLNFAGRDQVQFSVFTFANEAEWEDGLRSIHNAVESQQLGELEYLQDGKWSSAPPEWLRSSDALAGQTDDVQAVLTE